jgi:hypothetical protein
MKEGIQGNAALQKDTYNFKDYSQEREQLKSL